MREGGGGSSEVQHGDTAVLSNNWSNFILGHDPGPDESKYVPVPANIRVPKQHKSSSLYNQKRMLAQKLPMFHLSPVDGMYIFVHSFGSLIELFCQTMAIN